jgi:hypothetical protein
LFLPSYGSENVERRTHIPRTAISLSVHTESTSVEGKHQRRIRTGYEPWILFTITGFVELAIDKLTTKMRFSRSVQEQRGGAGETIGTRLK